MKTQGKLVIIAGIGLNLALGFLYAWSILGSHFTEPLAHGGFGWSKTQATLPYICAIAVFSLIMIPAGRLQDRYGPRIVASLGAMLLGGGLIVCGFAAPDNIYPALVGFGFMSGAGIGLGYASATPAAVKWFPAEKTGLIAGLVVSGFGLAPVYIAPLMNFLLSSYGVNKSLQILGAGFVVYTAIVAQFIRNPATHPGSAGAPARVPNWREMLRSPRFYFLYFAYASGAAAGLMMIGHLAKIVSVQSEGQIKIGFVFVALLAVFNAGGRVLAGIVSDSIGRVATILIAFSFQSATLFMFDQFSSIWALLIGSAIVGLNFGACFALFPAAAADYWGTRNLGMNYGILFTAWGVGGVFGPLLAGRAVDLTGSYSVAYNVAATLLLFAAGLSLLTLQRSRRAAYGQA